jgi:hypothetical protein
MSRTPIAGPHTEGRIFGTDWSIANVATLLRANAARGVWRNAGTTGGHMAKVNQYYLRTVSARHLPTSASLIFMRLEPDNRWYASLCFADSDDYLPWNADAAERWLWALFGQDRQSVIEDSAANPGDIRNPNVRQFTLAKAAAI